MKNFFKRLKIAISILVSQEYAEYIQAVKDYDVASALLEQLNKKIRDSGYRYEITPADGLIISRHNKTEERLKAAKKAAGVK